MRDNEASDLFFASLQTNDVATRRKCLDNLENLFEVDKGRLVPYQNGNCNYNENSNIKEDLTLKYPILLRLAHECPFNDVRVSCANILQKLKNDGVCIPERKHVGPSKFIPQKDCITIDSDNNEVQLLFVEAFINKGRTSHIDQLLGYHVRYLSYFLEFESALMNSNGSLHIDWCYYIGILGASRHKCTILIEECERNFLMVGGDLNWLHGINGLPEKLKKLHKLNKYLAHQPWLISEDIIKDLMSGPPAERWNMTEIVHAVIILVHYQSLSGFVYGCGVTPEIDSRKGYLRRSPSNTDYSSGGEALTPTKLHSNMLGLKHFEEPRTAAQLFQKIQDAMEEEDDSSQELQKEEEQLRQFQEVEIKELDEEDEEFLNHATNNNTSNCYKDENDMHYEEFAKRKLKDIEVFRAHDFNWSEHCFSFINRVCPEMGTLLDNKFQCTFELTYNTMGDSIKNVDTSKFRLATWNYIHLVYGIFHDDYVYYEVNKLLEKSYKSYIKKVACFPERITFSDYWDFYTDLLPSEKVHINLLVLESRMQALLLYATRSVMKCMNKQ